MKKKLNQKEMKSLWICIERIRDCMLRVQDITDTITKKDQIDLETLKTVNIGKVYLKSLEVIFMELHRKNEKEE